VKERHPYYFSSSKTMVGVSVLLLQLTGVAYLFCELLSISLLACFYSCTLILIPPLCIHACVCVCVRVCVCVCVRVCVCDTVACFCLNVRMLYVGSSMSFSGTKGYPARLQIKVSMNLHKAGDTSFWDASESGTLQRSSRRRVGKRKACGSCTRPPDALPHN